MFFNLMADGMSGGSIPSGTPSVSSAPTAPATPSPGIPVSSSGQATSPTSSAPSHFYDYKFEDGKEFKFTSKDELDSFFRGGVLRHDSFTKKTQELAEKRKSFEAEQKRLQDSFDRLSGLETKYKPIDEFLMKNPQVMQEIIQKYKGKTSTPAQDESLRKELDELKKSLEDKEKKVEQENKRKQIYSWMGERYQDFDGESIDKFLAEMLETPEGDEMFSLVNLAYLANKGKMSPAQVESAMANNLAKKQNIKPAMTSSGNVPNGPRGFKSLEEAAEAAKAKYG